MGQALRTPQFIAIALTYFACCATHSGPIFHMVTNAIDHGISAMAATTVLSVAGLASLGGKIVCGLIADRVGAKRTLVVGLAIQAVAVSLYVFAGELPSFYALAVMFGFAYGGVMPLYAILVREYFGARIMGSHLRRGRLGVHARHVARAVDRWSTVRRVRQLLLALHRIVRDRPRRGGHRASRSGRPAAAPGRNAESGRGPAELSELAERHGFAGAPEPPGGLGGPGRGPP